MQHSVLISTCYSGLRARPWMALTLCLCETRSYGAVAGDLAARCAAAAVAAGAACSLLEELDLELQLQTERPDVPPYPPLAALAHCTALRRLALSHSHVNDNTLNALVPWTLDLSPLAACRRLCSLILQGCYAGEPDPHAVASPLAPTLTSLNLLHCALDKQRLPFQLTNLAHVAISLDWAPPEGYPTASELLSSLPTLLPSLTSLDLVLDSVNDVPLPPSCDLLWLLPLFAGRLRHLALSLPETATGAVDLVPLASCEGLQTLDLQCWNTADVDCRPLAALSALQALVLSECSGLADVRPLASLSALRFLDLSRTAVTDLTPLTSCTLLIGSCECEGVLSCGHLGKVQGLGQLLKACPKLLVASSDFYY